MADAAHIFLVGFMGSGKSTVGTVVARELQRPFIDTDALIESREGRRVAQVFQDSGELYFREIESAVLRAVAGEQPAVVACGGGIVLRDENRELLARSGHAVYLAVSAGEALARIGDTATRPLLAGPSGALAASSLLAARERLYRSVAEVTIETDGLAADGVARLVLAAVREAGW